MPYLLLNCSFIVVADATSSGGGATVNETTDGGANTDGNLSSRSVIIPPKGPGVYLRHQRSFTRSKSKSAVSATVSEGRAESLSSINCPRMSYATLTLVQIYVMD